MVGRSVRGDAEYRKRSSGVRAAGVYRWRVEHERRSRFKLCVHCRPVYLGFKVNNKCVRFAKLNGYGVNRLCRHRADRLLTVPGTYNNKISIHPIGNHLNFIHGNDHLSFVYLTSNDKGRSLEISVDVYFA
jgi:hypothetical protein